MKAPKEINCYCPKCRVYTAHSVSIYKKGKERAMAQGTRRYERKKKGYGSSRKPVQKRTAKTTKKMSLRLKCKKCGYMNQRRGQRLKKLELV